MSKHTPGPWFAKAEEIEVFVTDADHTVIADLPGIYVGQMATAKLIAAAPDLLEALQATASYVQTAMARNPQYSQFSADLAKVRAAIAKATGEA